MQQCKQAVSLDLESYYSTATGYTLTKMTTEEYIRDARAEMLCLGVCERGKPAYSVPQPDLQRFFAQAYDWNETAVLCHHAHFDGLFFNDHFGMRPGFWLDTLSMARAILPRGTPLSLGKLCERFGLPQKTVPYNLFVEKRWADMSDQLRQQLMAGAAHDAALNWALFDAIQRVRPFPASQARKVDWVVRCFTEPQLVGDAEAFEAVAVTEAARKEAILAQLGLTRAELASADKFAQLLTALGVEVEFKTNPKGDKLIPALAKNDTFMKGLLEHEDETVQLLAKARLEVRSTIRESRAGRLADMARRGKMCAYYYYSGAHTHRLSGGDKSNMQNMERGGAIRAGFKAP
jgi:hypothetical protein